MQTGNLIKKVACFVLSRTVFYLTGSCIPLASALASHHLTVVFHGSIQAQSYYIYGAIAAHQQPIIHHISLQNRYTISCLFKNAVTVGGCFICYKKIAVILIFSLVTSFVKAQLLPGFQPTRSFNEQELNMHQHWENVVISINAPMQLKHHRKTYLVFFALPNGNTIEWTKGKKLKDGDDWHFNIQHIAAQTRYVRAIDSNSNYIVAYLMSTQKSWPAWKKSTPCSLELIQQIVDSVTHLFNDLHPAIVLNGHSGGGSFIFGYLDAVPIIPARVERIAFLDSDYGYSDSLHAGKLITWLKNNKQTKLVVLAYNDSLVVYNGKPLVSPTGGTWYRSRLMQRNLSAAFHFTTNVDTAFIIHQALKQRVLMILKENPDGQIFHTVQVERNGFILSLLTATSLYKRPAFQYFGERIYERYIGD